MADKSKLAAIILSGMKPKGDMPESDPEDMQDGGADESSEDDSGDSDTMSAAKEVMMSLKSGDTAGFADALKAFVKLCSYDQGE